MKEKGRNMKRTLQKLTLGILFLGLCASILLSAATPVLAFEGSVTIMMPEGITGPVTMGLYKLCSAQGDGWTWADGSPFLDVKAEVEELEATLRSGETLPGSDELNALMNRIGDIINKNEIKPLMTASTNADEAGASVSFGGLEDGIYFAMMTEGTTDKILQTSIIPVPYRYKDPISGKEKVLYGMTTYPKAVATPTPPTPTPPTPTPPTPTPPTPTPPTPTPPTPTPIPTTTPPPYNPPPPVNPNPPANPNPNPPGDQDNLVEIDDYYTPLGIEVNINHVGDCYE